MLQDQQGRPSGQVGFIDFGIVGRVTPVTWTALDALVTAAVTRDFETMARALATVGATDTDVDVKVGHNADVALLTSVCIAGIFEAHAATISWLLPCNIRRPWPAH